MVRLLITKVSRGISGFIRFLVLYKPENGASRPISDRPRLSVVLPGHSTTGSGVRGEASSISQAGVYGWNGSTGPGVVGYSSGGAALSAVGTGRIYSSADSALYLSPHDLVAREENQGLLGLMPLDNGGVRIRNLSGTGARYASMPVSTFGSLFGSTVYVKSLEVCYKTDAPLTFISATGVYKNNGSDLGCENLPPRSHVPLEYNLHLLPGERFAPATANRQLDLGAVQYGLWRQRQRLGHLHLYRQADTQ